MTAMHQQMAGPGRKPQDDARVPGIYLANQHWTLGRMLHFNHNEWMRTTCKSFYGVFGYMDVVLSPWIYTTATYAGLALLLLTIGALSVYANAMSPELLLCMAYAPVVVGLNIFGSMFHSLYIDYQPQGRYLFASLVGMLFLLFGTWPIEGRWWRMARGATLAMLISLSFYVLIEYAGINEALR